MLVLWGANRNATCITFWFNQVLKNSNERYASQVLKRLEKEAAFLLKWIFRSHFRVKRLLDKKHKNPAKPSFIQQKNTVTDVNCSNTNYLGWNYSRHCNKCSRTMLCLPHNGGSRLHFQQCSLLLSLRQKEGVQLSLRCFSSLPLS